MVSGTAEAVRRLAAVGHAHLAIVGVIDCETADELSVLVAGDFELALELE